MNEFHFEILRKALANIAHARRPGAGHTDRNYRQMPRQELVLEARKAFMQCGLDWMDYVDK